MFADIAKINIKHIKITNKNKSVIDFYPWDLPRLKKICAVRKDRKSSGKIRNEQAKLMKKKGYREDVSTEVLHQREEDGEKGERLQNTHKKTRWQKVSKARSDEKNESNSTMKMRKNLINLLDEFSLICL